MCCSRKSCKTFGFSLRRASARVADRRKAAPVAKAAEAVVCRNLGIIKDGQVVTAQAMEEFARSFATVVPPDAIAAFRALFKLDSEETEAVEQALIGNGGAAALDHEEAVF